MLSNRLGSICPQSYCFRALIENLFNRLLLALGNISDTFVTGVHTDLATCPKWAFGFGERNIEINKPLLYL